MHQTQNSASNASPFLTSSLWNNSLSFGLHCQLPPYFHCRVSQQRDKAQQYWRVSVCHSDRRGPWCDCCWLTGREHLACHATQLPTSCLSETPCALLASVFFSSSCPRANLLCFGVQLHTHMFFSASKPVISAMEEKNCQNTGGDIFQRKVLPAS